MRPAPLALAALLLLPRPALAWGPTVYRAVVQRAVDSLPSPLKGFYKARLLLLPSVAPDSAPPQDSPDRRFPADRYVPYPFTELPRNEEALKARFGEAAGPGRLPWLLLESHARLVEAFKAKDEEKILAESDTLASLVADLDNPLAVTDNADGQKTGQHGLYVRFCVKLPEAMDKRLKLDSPGAFLLDDPRDYVFASLRASYVWVDNLLYEEDLARRGQGGYTDLYYEALEKRAGPLLKARLSQAAGDAGSFWYSAWTAAGKPELKTTASKPESK
jgi:hypothetical protein